MSFKYVSTALLVLLLVSTSSATWFDSSYEYRHNISQTNTSQELLGPLNSTSAINEGYDSQNHWIYGTWRGKNSEYLDIYHQNQSNGGWNDTAVANSSKEYCVIQTLPKNHKSCPGRPDGLVYFYPLDESGNKAFDYISGNNGTIQSGVTQGTTGKIGESYEFDGSNDGVETDTISFDIAGNTGFTFSAWIKPDFGSSHNDDETIMRWKHDGNNNIGLRYDADNGWLLGWSNSGTFFDENHNSGNWYLYTATVDKTGNAKGYWNGKQTTTASFGSATGTDSASIGYRSSSGGWEFDGNIDNIRIYNRSLTSEEVQALYYQKASLGVEETQEDNEAPVLKSNSPENINKNNNSGVTLEAEIGDSDNDQMNLTFYNASDDSQIGRKENINNGTYTTIWNNLESDKTYEYYIEMTDGTDTTTSSTFSFTTIDIDLTWEDNSDNEDGFRVYQNSSGSYKEVVDLSSETTNYRDTNKNLDFGSHICYNVTSYNDSGESDPATGCITP